MGNFFVKSFEKIFDFGFQKTLWFLLNVENLPPAFAKIFFVHFYPLF